MSGKSEFVAACNKLADKIEAAPITYAKMYGKGELDFVYKYLRNKRYLRNMPSRLKQLLFETRRRWHMHQMYVVEQGKESLAYKQPHEPLPPKLPVEEDLGGLA